jgi:hypothetical protein
MMATTNATERTDHGREREPKRGTARPMTTEHRPYESETKQEGNEEEEEDPGEYPQRHPPRNIDHPVGHQDRYPQQVPMTNRSPR